LKKFLKFGSILGAKKCSKIIRHKTSLIFVMPIHVKKERDVIRPFQERVATAADRMMNSHWNEGDERAMMQIFHLKRNKCAVYNCQNFPKTQEHMFDIVSKQAEVRGVHGACNMLPMCLKCNESANYSYGYKKHMCKDSEIHNFLLDGKLSSEEEENLKNHAPAKYAMYSSIMKWTAYCKKRNLQLSYKWKREDTERALCALDVCWKRTWQQKNSHLLRV